MRWEAALLLSNLVAPPTPSLSGCTKDEHRESPEVSGSSGKTGPMSPAARAGVKDAANPELRLSILQTWPGRGEGVIPDITGVSRTPTGSSARALKTLNSLSLLREAGS